jgi:hypothetical protein
VFSGRMFSDKKCGCGIDLTLRQNPGGTEEKHE